MIIGLDLDDTLIDTNGSFIKKVSNELGYNFKVSDLMDWGLNCFPEDFRKRSFELFCTAKFMTSIQFFNGIKDKLKIWRNKGHILKVITARDFNIKNETISFVKENLPMIKDVIVVGRGNSKKDYMVDLDVFIDDSPNSIRDAIEVGISNIFMISNEGTSYNISHIDNFKKYGIKVVSSMIEVEI